MIETSSTSNKETTYTAFSAKLKGSREALGLNHKEAAQQLKLNENIVAMLESGNFSSRLPFTFIRGYLRNYCKLLEVPENEVDHIIHHLQSQIAKPTAPAVPGPLNLETKLTSNTSLNNFSIKVLTIIILVTLLSLFAVWWATEKPVHPFQVTAVNQNIKTITEPSIKIEKKPNQLYSEESKSIQKRAIGLVINLMILLFIFYLSFKYFQKPSAFFNRNYRHYPSSSRLNRSLFSERPGKKLLNMLGRAILKLPYKIILSLIIISLVIAGYFWWHSMTHTNKKQSATTFTEQTLNNNSPVFSEETDIDINALSLPDVANMVLKQSRPAPIQILFLPLTSTLSEMAAKEKYLTDPTTDFGPYKPVVATKKKVVTNRPQYLNYEDNSEYNLEDNPEYEE